jgi:CheY-like chemotaxis protein
MAEKKTVLIVDDDADFIEATRAVLESAGYAVESATTGQAGVERARKGGIDLVLLDVMMTRDTEGFHVARELKDGAETGDLPIIMLTSVAQATGFEFSPETDSDYMPVDAFLEKPVDPETLIKRASDILESKEA